MDNKRTCERSEWVNGEKCPVRPGKPQRTARYNNTDMLDITVHAMEGFAKRLTALRMAKNISAREMSLSLGMTANYINSIESGESFPSMTMFFEICEYLRISPKGFFAYTENKLGQIEELKRCIDTMSTEELEIMLTIVKMIKK